MAKQPKTIKPKVKREGNRILNKEKPGSLSVKDMKAKSVNAIEPEFAFESKK